MYQVHIKYFRYVPFEPKFVEFLHKNPIIQSDGKSMRVNISRQNKKQCLDNDSNAYIFILEAGDQRSRKYIQDIYKSVNKENKVPSLIVALKSNKQIQIAEEDMKLNISQEVIYIENNQQNIKDDHFVDFFKQFNKLHTRNIQQTAKRQLKYNSITTKQTINFKQNKHSQNLENIQPTKYQYQLLLKQNICLKQSNQKLQKQNQRKIEQKNQLINQLTRELSTASHSVKQLQAQNQCLRRQKQEKRMNIFGIQFDNNNNRLDEIQRRIMNNIREPAEQQRLSRLSQQKRVQKYKTQQHLVDNLCQLILTINTQQDSHKKITQNMIEIRKKCHQIKILRGETIAKINNSSNWSFSLTNGILDLIKPNELNQQFQKRHVIKPDALNQQVQKIQQVQSSLQQSSMIQML